MPSAPPGGLYTTERSKFAGFTVFCCATTPNRPGHDRGLAACTVSATRPFVSASVTKLFVSRCTIPGVTGLPASCSDTAWVSGLSGISGRYRTGIGYRRSRLATVSGGTRRPERCWVEERHPGQYPSKSHRGRPARTLPKTLLTFGIFCSFCCESRYLLETQTGNGSASSTDH